MRAHRETSNARAHFFTPAHTIIIKQSTCWHNSNHLNNLPNFRPANVEICALLEPILWRSCDTYETRLLVVCPVQKQCNNLSRVPQNEPLSPSAPPSVPLCPTCPSSSTQCPTACLCYPTVPANVNQCPPCHPAPPETHHHITNNHNPSITNNQPTHNQQPSTNQPTTAHTHTHTH